MKNDNALIKKITKVLIGIMVGFIFIDVILDLLNASSTIANMLAVSLAIAGILVTSHFIIKTHNKHEDN